MNRQRAVRCAVRKILVAVASALSLAFAACAAGNEADPDAADASTSSGPATGTPTDGGASPQEDAADVLSAAVSRMVGGEAIRFTYELRLMDDPMIETAGVQRLSGGWSASSTFTDPTGSTSDIDMTMEARSADGTTWMQMAAWPAAMAGCWLEMGASEVPLGISGLRAGEVGYVSVLAALESPAFVDGSDSELTVQVPIANAQLLVQGQALEQVDVEADTAEDLRVPATVSIADDRVTSIRMSGEDFVDAITEAGGTVGDMVELTLTPSDAVATYSPSTPDDVLGPPADDLVVTQDQATQGCH